MEGCRRPPSIPSTSTRGGARLGCSPHKSVFSTERIQRSCTRPLSRRVMRRVAMDIRRLTWALAALHAPYPHGVIGNCCLPATLAIDDPFVADELSLPTVSHIKTPASSDSPATKETDLSAEFSKRLTPNLGVSLAGTYTILDQEH